MNRSTAAHAAMPAHRAPALPNLSLPFDVPREAWPALVAAGARTLLDANCGAAELADDLLRIAAMMQRGDYGLTIVNIIGDNNIAVAGNDIAARVVTA